MKALVAILILISFLQTTIVPLDLVLIILLLRSYIRPEKANLYLAFGLGLLTSHLAHLTLGIHSLIYLISVQLAHLASQTHLARHIITILPAVATFLLAKEAALSLFSRTSVKFWPEIFWEIILSVPIYFLLKVWEERFVIKQEFKLKV